MIDKIYYETKGDGNDQKDGFVIYKENIICKVKIKGE